MAAHKLAPAGACQHSNYSIENRAKGIVQRTVCGDVRRCPASRAVRLSRDRRRLALVRWYVPARDTPTLFTCTSATREVDARYLSRKMVRARIREGATVAASCRADPESLAPYMFGCPWNAHDYADPYSDGAEFSHRVSRMSQYVHRQHQRQLREGYASSRFASKLAREYGTAFPVAGAPEARLRIRRLEAGEKTGRPHAHFASDFTFIDMRTDHRGTRRGFSWFGDVCARFGLGFPQYEKRETRAAARASAAGGDEALAHYLTKYLSSGDPNASWPWRPHQRTLSAVRGALPPLPPSDWEFANGSVAQVARLTYGAVIDREAGYFNASSGEVRISPPETKSAFPPAEKEGSAGFLDAGAGEAIVPDGFDGAIAGPRGDHSVIAARKSMRHDPCSDSLDQERDISARRVRSRWEQRPASTVMARITGPPRENLSNSETESVIVEYSESRHRVAVDARYLAMLAVCLVGG